MFSTPVSENSIDPVCRPSRILERTPPGRFDPVVGSFELSENMFSSHFFLASFKVCVPCVYTGEGEGQVFSFLRSHTSKLGSRGGSVPPAFPRLDVTEEVFLPHFQAWMSTSYSFVENFLLGFAFS